MLDSSDKKGRVEHPNWLFNGFREVIHDCSLFDLPLVGYHYIWSRKRGPVVIVEERIDRALVTEEWLDLFPNATLNNCIASISDHSPILLCLSNNVVVSRRRNFKFENSCLYESTLRDTVQASWAGSHASCVVEKVGNCASDIERWARNIRPQFRVEAGKCKRQMEFLRGLEDEEAAVQFSEQKDKLALLLVQEEAYWKQRAKTFWLRDGDANTKYFHAIASSKKRRNVITKLRNDGNEVIAKQEGLCEIAKEYFSNLFQEHHNSYELVINEVSNKLSEKDNLFLLLPFSIHEFRLAISHMHPDKAPGPDGLNPAFYHKFWDICGEDIFKAKVTQSIIQETHRELKPSLSIISLKKSQSTLS